MSRTAPKIYAVVLFPGFQLLDVAGPLDILNLLKADREPDMKLYVVSSTMDPVSCRPGQAFDQVWQPTHTFSTCPTDIEVLLVPGGPGVRDEGSVKAAQAFVKAVYPKLRHLITVCAGSALVARTGILDGKRATSNKASFQWAKTQGPAVSWIPEARWVTDGNFWTSSGISAGMDVTYAFVTKYYGEDVAQLLADRAEYVRHKDSTWDPFAARWLAD